ELGALLWVVLQIIAHSQPVGQFVFVQQMVGRAMGSVRSLATQLGRMDDDFAHMIDYQKFMELDIAEDSGEEMKGAPQTISLQRVWFHYPNNKRPVLRN